MSPRQFALRPKTYKSQNSKRRSKVLMRQCGLAAPPLGAELHLPGGSGARPYSSARAGVLLPPPASEPRAKSGRARARGT